MIISLAIVSIVFGLFCFSIFIGSKDLEGAHPAGASAFAAVLCFIVSMTCLGAVRFLDWGREYFPF